MAGIGGAQPHGTWTSRFGFIMAAVGSSVGLGNFWRFPYTAGENGGAAFVLVYLLCVVLIAFPILIAELAVGRHARLSAVGSTRKMAFNAGASEKWSLAGWAGMTAAFLILGIYSVVAAWVGAYVVKMANGSLVGVDAETASAAFAALQADQSTVIAWHTGFMAVTALIVIRGVTAGIERTVTILMPIFFAMLVGMVIYALIAGDAAAAARYLFVVDFSKINAGVVINALSQACFSIGVGAAIMITYGSYLSRRDNLTQSATIIVSMDTAVALIAGMAIFPFVFAFTALDPNGGPALLFQALPAAFAQMPGGQWVGTAFFALALIAALTSSISLLQVVVAWAEEHTDLGRIGATVVIAAILWLIGVGSATSGEFFNLLDFLQEKVMLPLGALTIALFVGWVASKQLMRLELPHAGERVFRAWRFALRYFAPIAVAAILVSGLWDHFSELAAANEAESGAQTEPER